MRPLPLLASLMIPLGVGLASPPPAEAQLLNLLLGDSNYYGRVTTPWWGGRDWPQDALLYRRPVIVSRRNPGRAPLYLRVPENQARNWGRYCRRYTPATRPCTSCGTTGIATCMRLATATATGGVVARRAGSGGRTPATSAATGAMTGER